MKRFRRILAIGCVLCIIVTSTVICLAATVRAPKPDGQNKNLWCWATAAKLVAENNGGAWIDSTAAVLSDTNGLHSGPRDMQKLENLFMNHLLLVENNCTFLMLLMRRGALKV